MIRLYSTNRKFSEFEFEKKNTEDCIEQKS